MAQAYVSLTFGLCSSRTRQGHLLSIFTRLGNTFGLILMLCVLIVSDRGRWSTQIQVPDWPNVPPHLQEKSNMLTSQFT